MKLKIESLDPSRISGVNYDLVLAGIGCELRARHFVETVMPVGKTKAALGFDRQKEFSYNSNVRHFRKAGYECSAGPLHEFAELSRYLIREAVVQTPNGADPRIAVDITSLSRGRIASLVEALAEESRQRPVHADFVYSLAEYSAPGKQPDLMTICKPVSDYFTGWSSHPERPLAAFMGIGYELEKAIGVLEYLEPGWIWVFFPIGSDERYDVAVRRANNTLLEELSRNLRIDYLVTKPVDCYTVLNSLVSKVKETARPVLIPFGPKIFALNAMLVGLSNNPDVSVWRVSARQRQDPVQRKPSGELLAVSVRFGMGD